MFSLSCSSYPDGGIIPSKYVHRKAKGQNVSPGFSWKDPPIETKSFALLIVDPHRVAGNWVHWCVVNIPFRERTIPEGASRSGSMPPGAKELDNTYGEQGYGGPAPPRGTGQHPYVATIYALNIPTLTIPAGASFRQFQNSIGGKVIAEASVTGLYEVQ